MRPSTALMQDLHEIIHSRDPCLRNASGSYPHGGWGSDFWVGASKDQQKQCEVELAAIVTTLLKAECVEMSLTSSD